jgi:hypothetical protein
MNAAIPKASTIVAQGLGVQCFFDNNKIALRSLRKLKKWAVWTAQLTTGQAQAMANAIVILWRFTQSLSRKYRRSA